MIAATLRRFRLSSRTRAFLVLSVGWLISSMASAADNPPSASEILQELKAFRECGSMLYVAAHPDDENTQLIAYLAKERGMRVGYLSLTRGEGGQNLIGPELGDALGVIRTQELLAARRIDGGQQFFTRARDFGYSKDSEQTLAKWDRQGVLSDMVRVIRLFRPDVIVTRFPPEAGGTHGHHTASAVLAVEAFKMADDPKAFPEQLVGPPGGLTPWQPKRIFWNAFRGGASRPTMRFDIGGYLTLLGESVGEIAALSRSSHRSQGFGAIANRGVRLDEFQPLDGQPAGKDLFDGLNAGWSQYPSGDKIDAAAGEIAARFKPLNPGASVPALLDLRGLVTMALGDSPCGDYKTRQVDRLLQACLGLYVETTVPQAEVVPGEILKYHHTALLRATSPVPVVWQGVWSMEGEGKEAELRPGQPLVRDNNDTMSIHTLLSQPYWLRAEGTPGMYRIDDASLIGRAEAPAFHRPIVHLVRVGSQQIRLPVEPLQIIADPAKGEIHRQLDVIPPVSFELGREVQLFKPGAAEEVVIGLKAYRDNQNGAVTLSVPTSWKVSPPSLPFQFSAVGDHEWFTFEVKAPAQAETTFLAAHATIGDVTYETSRQEIRYDHFPTQLLQPPARVKAVCLDVATRGHEIGYLPGAGDRTAEAIGALGYHVTTLSGADLTLERLKRFDAVVIGVRAFNVRTDLEPSLAGLFAYAESGGTVIEQYNTPRELKTTRLAPYRMTISPNLPQNRITNENAPVNLLMPDHPVLAGPNRIAAADFEGWVQERGLNFPSEWDHEHFAALLACGDPGEAPLQSGLLVAHHGKGYFVYTGLSFFRQLPAGVPGAYRLFANLLSLGK